jgi:hypothetical protein
MYCMFLSGIPVLTFISSNTCPQPTRDDTNSGMAILNLDNADEE